MAIDYKIGDKLYLPVTVINGASQLYPIRVEFFCDIDTVDKAAIANKPGLLLTAEEIISNILLDNNNFITMPSKTVVSEEETRIKTLTEEVATLTEERDKARGDLVTAREAIDYLQEENKDLKRKLEIVEAARDGAIDEGLERKNRVVTMEEVIVALVEKIRRLEKENETVCITKPV